MKKIILMVLAVLHFSSLVSQEDSNTFQEYWDTTKIKDKKILREIPGTGRTCESGEAVSHWDCPKIEWLHLKKKIVLITMLCEDWCELETATYSKKYYNDLIVYD